MVDYLKEKYNFNHYSVRDFLVKEIINQGLEVNRDSMVLVGNDLRAKNHPGFIVEELAKKALAENKNVVIESIRTVGEIEVLKQQKRAYLIAIDAEQPLRFSRIRSRASDTDEVTFERFQSDEAREMTATDKTKQNLQACIKLADFTVLNNGSLTDLQKQVDEVMVKIDARS